MYPVILIPEPGQWQWAAAPSQRSSMRVNNQNPTVYPVISVWGMCSEYI